MNQRVEDDDLTSVLGEAGVSVAQDFGLGVAGLVTPYGSLALSYEFADANATTQGGFAGVPGAGSFQTDGPEVARAAVRIGLGAMVKPSEDGRLSFSLDYDGRYNQDVTDQSLTARVRFKF